MRGSLAAAAITALGLVAAPSALAHAVLVLASPSQGAVLEQSPERVVLRFDESVSTVAGSMRVFDGRARRVDDGQVDQPTGSELSVGLDADLPDDTYTVAWRVISADSHPIHGAYTFSVGEPGENASGVVDQVLGDEARSAAVGAALYLARLAGLALILLCVGGVAVLAFVVDQDARTRFSRIALSFAAVLLAVVSLALIALTGVDAAGFGLDAVTRWSLSEDVLDAAFGQVWLARAVLAAALAVVILLSLRTRSERWHVPAILIGSAIAGTPALSGHARVEGALSVVSDAVHVLAAGVWVGGLVFLVLVLVEAGGDRWSLASTAVPRFSGIALVAVIALVAAGIVNSLVEIGSLQGLWDTTYGRLVLAKIALLVPLLLLGAFNNRISVPRLRSGTSRTTDRRRFAGAVALELAVMVAVVSVTAVLVAEPPPKAQAATRLVSREGEVGPYDFTLVVDPARVGSNEIHAYVLQSSGQPAVVDEIELRTRLPAKNLGPLELEATPAGPGHVVAAGELPLAGSWQFELDVRKGEFDEWRAFVDIPIRKD